MDTRPPGAEQDQSDHRERDRRERRPTDASRSAHDDERATGWGSTSAGGPQRVAVPTPVEVRRARHPTSPASPTAQPHPRPAPLTGEPPTPAVPPRTPPRPPAAPRRSYRGERPDLFERRRADARHVDQVVHRRERPVLGPIVDDGRCRDRADAGQFLQLGLARGVDVDERGSFGRRSRSPTTPWRPRRSSPARGSRSASRPSAAPRGSAP